MNLFKRKIDIAALMQKHRDKLFTYIVYRIGHIEDAEDLLQDLYVTLQGKEHLFVKAVDRKNYLFKCVVNACNEYLRKKEQAQRLESEYQEWMADKEYARIDSFEDEFGFYERLLSKLPKEQVEVIQLKIYGECTFDEIAEIMKIPESTAKTRFYAGLDKLRTFLNVSNDEKTRY